MPLFSYVCENCRKSCELLVRAADTPSCPHCGQARLMKQASAVAPMGSSGGPVTGLPPSCESCCSRRNGSCPNL